MFKKKGTIPTTKYTVIKTWGIYNTYTAHREKTIDSNYYISTEDWKLMH